MAHSQKYQVEIEFDKGWGEEYGNFTIPDRWTIRVDRGWWVFASYVGSERIEHEPTDEEAEAIARRLIDEYLDLSEKRKPRKFNVRHP